MPLTRSLRAAPALALILLGCEGDPPDAPDSASLDAQPMLTTDQTSYTAVATGPEGPYRQFGFVVEVRFVNASRRILYLTRCAPTDAQPVFFIVPTTNGAVESATARRGDARGTTDRSWSRPEPRGSIGFKSADRTRGAAEAPIPSAS
jgi:hypothetical protein